MCVLLTGRLCHLKEGNKNIKLLCVEIATQFVFLDAQKVITNLRALTDAFATIISRIKGAKVGCFV